MRRCVRDHRLTGTNVELRPDGRMRCVDCHREYARLSRRIERVARVIDHHLRHCASCQAGGGCATLGALVGRLKARQRAFEAWRGLGRQNGTDKTHAAAP